MFTTVIMMKILLPNFFFFKLLVSFDRQQGFQNLYTLEGGVSHYLKNVGAAEWVGNLFVFDSRLALPPSTYKPEAMTEPITNQHVSENSTFARCFICGSKVHELRHRNCANLDCNLLFL